MELFIEHYKLNEEYKEAKKEFEKALAKKSQLLYSVVPKSANFENELVKGSSSNKFLNYTIKMEEIEQEICIRKNLADVLKERLKNKTYELRDSKEILDRVYVYRILDRRKPDKFYKLIPCSRSSAYNYCKEIYKKLKKS